MLTFATNDEDNRSIFEGNFAKDKKNGKGSLQWKTGEMFRGDFQNDYLQGFGLLTYAEDDSEPRQYYNGSFITNVKHGNGTLVWKNGQNYVGGFDYNKRHGYGILKTEDGEEYVGLWKKNKKNGFGVLTYSKGDVFGRISYVGNFKDNVRDGNGTLILKRGEYYEGEFRKDTFDGFGIFTQNDNVYKGLWKNGEKTGYGKITYTEKDFDRRLSYEGSFKNDDFSGNGTLIFKSGSNYTGKF